MSDMTVKKDLADNVDNAILKKFLDSYNIKNEGDYTRYAELTSCLNKVNADGKPYCVIKFKDVRGSIVNGISYCLNGAEIATSIKNMQRVMCEISFEVGQNGINLINVYKMIIVRNKEVCNKLLDSFSPKYENTKVLSERISSVKFGEELKDEYIKKGIFRDLENLPFLNYYDGRMGIPTRAIYDLFSYCNNLLVDKALVRAVSVFSIWYYCKNVRVSKLLVDNDIIELVMDLNEEIDSINNGTKYDKALFKSEVQRLVMALFDIPKAHSLTSYVIKSFLEMQKEIWNLCNKSNEFDGGALMEHNNQIIINY